MSTSDLGAVSGSATTWPMANSGSDKFAQFFNNLQAWQQQDPDKLKSVLSDIADKLNTAADSATGKQAQMLHDLAQKYQEAAKTGDLSQLKPAHRHHGRHRGGEQASSSDAQGTSTGVNMKQLFDSIFAIASEAVKAQPANKAEEASGSAQEKTTAQDGLGQILNIEA